MAAIKIHLFAGGNDGSESCDFRGEKFIGKGQGDEHRTLFEIPEATPDQIAVVLAKGPALNKQEDALLAFLRDELKVDTNVMAEGLHVVLGGAGAGATVCGFRIGVWDD